MSVDEASVGGSRRRLARAHVTVQRLARWIAAAVIMAGATSVAIVRLFSEGGLLPVGAAWVALAALLAFWAQAWPAIAWRHASYAVSSSGIEIRSGVVWQTVINVPRSRVQHTDVSQGPIERAYDLGSLSVYTAGTDHARVRLAGLEHAAAMQIRDQLLPGQADDAV